MDYKDLFESVFDNATEDELSCFLRNPSVPFEYCKRALKLRGERGIGWRNRLVIALRKDCPVDVLVRLCKIDSEKFAQNLLALNDFLPDEAIRALYHRKRNVYSLSCYWRLPEDVKRDIFMSYLNLDANGLVSGYDEALGSFLAHQVSLPDDCWKLMDGVIDVFRNRSSERGWYMRVNIVEIVRPMQAPLDDEYALQVIADTRHNGCWKMLQMAANPSVSDYVMMELRMKVDDAVLLSKINALLDENENARQEYRRTHP